MGQNRKKGMTMKLVSMIIVLVLGLFILTLIFPKTSDAYGIVPRVGCKMGILFHCKDNSDEAQITKVPSEKLTSEMVMEHIITEKMKKDCGASKMISEPPCLAVNEPSKERALTEAIADFRAYKYDILVSRTASCVDKKGNDVEKHFPGCRKELIKADSDYALVTREDVSAYISSRTYGQRFLCDIWRNERHWEFTECVIGKAGLDEENYKYLYEISDSRPDEEDAGHDAGEETADSDEEGAVITEGWIVDQGDEPKPGVQPP